MRTLQLQIDTYEHVTNQMAVKLILDIISRLQSKFSLKGLVRWSFDNDEIPLRKKWTNSNGNKLNKANYE